MTIHDFQEKYCLMCGTQSCLGRAEDISHCGYYNGEIEGLLKIKSVMELLEEAMKESGIAWDDIRKWIEEKKL